MNIAAATAGRLSAQTGPCNPDWGLAAMTSVQRKHDGIGEIDDWVSGYVKRHPMAAISTFGDQAILAVRTIQSLFVDLFTGKFQWKEFIRQAAFMAGTSVVPTIFVALPIGVTLSVQFALLAGQVGATSLAGADSGLDVIRQAAALVAR